MAGLEAVVVIPARDEAHRIAGCLRALADQTLDRAAFEVIVVLDGCSDRTDEAAAVAAGELGLALTLVLGPGRGPGPARRAGMDQACARLLGAGVPDGLVASTDADTRPRHDWLARQLHHLRAGARVVAGMIELDPLEALELPEGVLAARERDAAARLRRVRATDPDADHHHLAGASLGVAAATYDAVGGLPPASVLEDRGFGERLARHGVPVRRAGDVVVTTSARTDGRAAHGLSADLAVARWRARRRYHADHFGLERLCRAAGGQTVSVIVPVRECAETIGEVLERTVAPLADRGLIDELVVVDAGSRDGSATVAAAHGARVVQQDEIAPELGPALGKGDAMWRALQVTGGEIVCFLDGDTGNPAAAHLAGLLGPLFVDSALALVKGAFERPLHAGGRRLPHEGGRVTELMARPLLNLHAPLLAGFAQPLAGEFAVRRELLESVAFPVGYGVEIAVLLDALRLCGLDALAECDLGSRENRHQPLRALGEMAYAVLAAVERRREADGSVQPSGRYLRPWDDGSIAAVPVQERPPLREWVPAPTVGPRSGPTRL